MEYESWGLVKEVGCGPRPDTGVVHIIASVPGEKWGIGLPLRLAADSTVSLIFSS